MSMEQMGSEENLDPRLEEILSFYETGMREHTAAEWDSLSEFERQELHSKIMEDHK